MASVRGLSDVKRYLARQPGQLEKLMRGAGRAMATVVADEAKARVTSDAVREAVTINTRSDATRVVVTVGVKPGWARSVANWLEHGTSPHFISVDDSQRVGLSVRKVNQKTMDGSLVINGQFVGTTIHHPGARPHPFLRVSLDVKRGEAIAAGQSYVNARIGHNGGPSLDGEDDA